MPTCLKCDKKFKARQEVNGEKKNLSGRKYCLDCSPFGSHNTKKLNGKPRKDQKDKKPYKCKCGENDPKKFYGNRRSSCGKCHNKLVKESAKKKRKKAIDYLGGCCKICGYNKYYGSIDIHHLDPNKKDENFRNLSGWSWERIEKEIKGCIPLCRNCHGEVHAGIVKLYNDS